MKFINRRILALLLMFVCLLSIMPVPYISASSNTAPTTGSITLRYSKNDTLIPQAEFKIYKVATVDGYGNLTATSRFSRYAQSVLTHSRIDEYDSNEWADIAYTLSGYVARDAVAYTSRGKTGDTGVLAFNNLSLGVYLISGSTVTIGTKTYTSYPMMVVLPSVNAAGNGLLYNIELAPKCEVRDIPSTEPTTSGTTGNTTGTTAPTTTPPGGPSKVSRKVEKVWDDKGFESVRPNEIEVQLLCDGKVHDTQKLNKDNNWRYTWNNLATGHEWTVVEKELSNYTVKVEKQGITFVVTNKYVGPHATNEPIVNKSITGHKPASPGLFQFTLTAKNSKNPMPEGSSGSTKTVSVTGAGSASFGQIVFTEAGTYEYEVKEVKGDLQGYTYDQSVYTIVYTVTKSGDKVNVSSVTTKSDGSKAESIIFDNPYKNLGVNLPQTGVLWWPVPVLSFAGLLMILLGMIRRRGEEDEI